MRHGLLPIQRHGRHLLLRHPVPLIMDCAQAGASLTQMSLTGRVIQVQLHLPVQVPKAITQADQASHLLLANYISIFCFKQVVKVMKIQRTALFLFEYTEIYQHTTKNTTGKVQEKIVNY